MRAVVSQQNRKEAGALGEAEAAQFLVSRGYRIAGANVRPLPGMARGELDVIAWDGDILCFVEVKTRRTRSAPPDLSVSPGKRRQLITLAEAYLSVNDLDPETCRFDVISVWNDPALPCPMLTLHKDAFGVD